MKQNLVHFIRPQKLKQSLMGVILINVFVSVYITIKSNIQKFL